MMRNQLCCLALFSVIIAVMSTAVSGFAQEEQVVDRIIAVVDDEIILESEVLQFVQEIVIQDRKAYQSEEDIQQLKEQVLEELVAQKILLAVALEDTNIRVEDREVNQTLDERLNQIINQIGGEKKLEEYYGKPIRQIRREYRKQVRDGLLAEKVRTRKLQEISVSRREVEEFYREHREELPKLPEQVEISHILFKIEPAEEAKRNARTKADSIYRQLLAGSEFETLAMRHSDDRASGGKGGLLGTTERGDLVPEYEEVAFALKEGEISQPVKSRYGYHIIKLNWRRGEKINTSHILVSLAPTDKDEERTRQKAMEVLREIRDGADFADMAREYSQDEETAKLGGDLGWFDLPKMPEEFSKAAKELEIGEVSEPFKSRFGYHLLKLTGRQKARILSPDKDWERLSRMARAEKQDKVYKEWVEKLKEDVYVEIYRE